MNREKYLELFGDKLKVLIQEISRDDMPQIKGDDIKEACKRLEEYGIKYEEGKTKVSELKPSQDTFSKKKREDIKKGLNEGQKLNPIFISQDNHVIDGHHRMLACKDLYDKDFEMPTIKLLSVPKNDALLMFGKTEKDIQENTEKEMDIVVVFSGRFSPFHPGHYSVYQFLTKKFGKDNVFIGTSNKVKPPRSPFNFNEKKQIITSLYSDIPKDKVVQVKNPFKPVEVLEKFDDESTVYVSSFSEKDAGRLGGKYFKKWTDKNLKPYPEEGYYIVAPEKKIQWMGDHVSGTSIRRVFGSDKYSEEEKKDGFKQLYGKFDKKIYDLLTKKLEEEKLSELVIDQETLFEFLQEVDLDKIIKESSNSPKASADDGPPTFYKNMKHYRGDIAPVAEQFGMTIIDHLTEKGEEDELIDYTFRFDVMPVISFGSAGIEGPAEKPFKKYKGWIRRVAERVGYEIMDFMGVDDIDDQGVHIRSPYIYSTARGEGEDREEWGEDLYEYQTPSKTDVSEFDKITDRKFKTGTEFVNFMDKHKDDLEFYDSDYFKTESKKIRNIIKNNKEKITDVYYGSELNNRELISFTIEVPREEMMDKFGGKDNELFMRYDIHVTSSGEEKSEVEVEFSKFQLNKKLNIMKGVTGIAYAHYEPKGNLITDSDKSLNNKDLLREGGAAGRLNHPFDDWDLTFEDLYKIIHLSLQGKLDIEQPASEKLDGQNLKISWKNGQLIGARNKGQIKDFGANALNRDGIEKMFDGRGEVQEAFTYAMKDLESAISKLTDKQKQKVFGEGHRFMSLEILYPPTTNVIPYGLNLLVFHNVVEYDEDGKEISSSKEYARMLAGMIKQINQNVQETFEISPPRTIKMVRPQDFSDKIKKYDEILDRLRNEYGLKKTDPIYLYHQKKWENFITIQAENFDYPIPNHVFMNLVKRWAFGDKSSYSIRQIKKEIDNPEFLEWAIDFDKKDHQKEVKKNLRPFELLFLKVGVDALKNIKGLIAVNTDETIEKIRKDLYQSIKELEQAADVRKIERYKDQLEKLQQLGGIEAIMPTEGIVFVFKGKLFKLTGSFAPLNQLIGLLKF